ncbi:MAG: ADP-ribosylglycohydrolase family protein [Rhodothermus sp.]|nr:ADP-ribosylglycohydrolase family protein [Rhodothermus sp.]
MTADRMLGALLGTAVGDALGMPVEGLSHTNVRTYYKGIKQYEPDRHRRDLAAGQWTDDTQFTFALTEALTEWLRTTDQPDRSDTTLTKRLADAYVALLPRARRWGATSRTAIERLTQGIPWTEAGDATHPSNGAAMRAAPLGIWWAVYDVPVAQALSFIFNVLGLTHRHPVALVAGFGQAFAVAEVLRTSPDSFDPRAFWNRLLKMVRLAETEWGDATAACSSRLQRLTDHLCDFPLDLQDLCHGTGPHADESWPFAVAMFARNPDLLEATLLSAINVGGDADTVGAMVGSLLGARHGWSAFPEAWRSELEAVHRLEAIAHAFLQALHATH